MQVIPTFHIPLYNVLLENLKIRAGFFRNWKKVCVTVSGYTLKWASTSETRSKWYAMKGATVSKTMQFRFQISNMTELRERESTGGSSYSGKEGSKRSLPSVFYSLYRCQLYSYNPFLFSLYYYLSNVSPYLSPYLSPSLPSSLLLSSPLSLIPDIFICQLPFYFIIISVISIYLSSLISPCLVIPFLTLPDLTVPYLILPYLINTILCVCVCVCVYVCCI